MTQDQRDSAMRILGARDCYAHVVVDLNARIGNIMATQIDERHVRKLAERDRLLRPLVSLRDQYERQMRECSDALKARMAEQVN